MKTTSFFLAAEPVSYGPDTRSPADYVPEMIRSRAYQIYECRGREPGHELDDWVQAEREIEIRLGIIYPKQTINHNGKTNNMNDKRKIV